MDGMDEGGDDGARVGEEFSELGGKVAGSKSLSGTGVLSTGRRVIRRIKRRRIALCKVEFMRHQVHSST